MNLSKPSFPLPASEASAPEVPRAALGRFGRALATAWCVVWLPLVAAVDALVVWPPLLVWGLVRRRPLDGLARIYNQHFGRAVVTAAWPLVRLERHGFENMPVGPCVLTINHRSFCDILLCAFLPWRRYVVFVRSWPFRMWPLSHFMRLAGYKDIESNSMEEIVEGCGRRHLEMGDCFLFFPEGHRSRTGRLQRFRQGAFTLATRYNLPVAPVCVSGTEGLMSGRPWVSPIRVRMTMLPPVEPASMTGPHPDLELKQTVQQIYREFFGEH